MLKKTLYSQEELDEAVETYLGDIKLRVGYKAFPNVPKRTISCLAKNKKDGIEANRPEPLPF
jgi:hypothetical protein